MSRDQDPDQPVSPAEFFGREIQRRRELMGLTQAKLGEQIVMSPQMIAHFEAARRKPRLDDAKRLDQALCSDGFFFRMRRALDDRRFADHFATAVELEQLATVIKCFAPSLVPGLLQTEDYAKAVFRAGAVNPTGRDVEKLVANRLERAKILDGQGGPCMWALLDEHVLRRPVGGPATMARQLRHIAGLIRRGRVRTHVVPFSAGAHALLESMLVLMCFADAPPVAYVEGVQTGRVLDDPAVVDKCSSAYDLALGDALSAEDSLALIEEVADTYDRDC
ncbi:helix-turn-helix transcriptional regulator [Streptomyces cocklensis]|uniref:Helix-turn-helix n=1 Tax=Actinacidiphila cocklensis TaxID=887465 RepID=A0A9W4GUX7_9ACTN|nr:helix-turn-helix transcriptional regulator [Actinacidiphila cocklensis]MDD1061887.1 helix-turn-helix transcriptional regulator [Actinacidiphila cocklensis]CAG6396142.1 Helix-turn-helix [Actinacidiphila cocklensis]